MELMMFVIWLFFWIVFLFMSVIEERTPVFGMVAGLWILFLGLIVIIDGLQVLSGQTFTTVGDTVTVANTYQDVVSPFTNFNYTTLWGIPFIALSLFIMFVAATRPKKKAQ